MLCQLVCVDRRYQRMNCFNIRELQGILKRRFFTDLVNSNDHHELLNNTMINLRFKLNNTQSIEPDIFTFYNIGTTTSLKTKSSILNSIYSWNNTSNQSTFFYNYNIFELFSNYRFNLVNFEQSINIIFSSFIDIIKNFHYSSFMEFINYVKYIPTLFSLNFNLNFNYMNFQLYTTINTSQPDKISFTSNQLSTNNTTDINYMSEDSNSGRFVRFSNSMINYDYKCGHYLGI